MNASEYRRDPRGVRATVAAILGTALLGGYVAQAVAADENLEEVQVTGSRIKRATDFDTANPTTVLDSQYFQNMGIVNVGDAIREMPANLSTNTPATTGNSNFFTGSTIANLRGLNPFFGSRTLTLVDGQRFVPTNQGDGVDLNFIPTVLIDRMDVVTGGGSAAYGSGAVTGVQNIFLNHTLQGGRVEMDYGQSNHDDARSRHIGAAFGTDFADGRGHVVIGYEGQKSDALGCETVRSWCATNTGFIANPAFVSGAATPNVPQYIIGSNLRTNLTSYGGTLIPFGGAASNVNAAGTGLEPAIAGVAPGGGALGQGVSVIGGDGATAYQYTNLLAPVDRNVASLFAKWKLTDDINLKFDASYGKVETVNKTAALNENYTFITPQNAYLNSALSAYAPFGGFLSKDWNQQVNSYTQFDTRVARFSLGADGKFGDSSWSWDAYYTYGDTSRTQYVANNVHFQAYSYATDTVTVNGVPTCRVTALLNGVAGVTGTAPAAGSNNWYIAQGCVPLNPFGTGALSPAAQQYAFGSLLESLTYIQQVAAFNASGELFQGFGAGPIRGAVGVEYRNERGNNVDSEADLAGMSAAQAEAVHTDYLIQYGNSFSGKVQVIEGYAEADIPFLKDVPGARLLDLDLAVRESSYHNTAGANTSGGSATNDLTTYKASLIWDPVDWLRARGSYSRDARAANFRELYYAQDIQAGSLFGYCPETAASGHGYPNPYPVADPCAWLLRGNPALKPETSDTYTVGLVFTPKDVLPNFQFAMDYAHIKIKDAIQQASVSQTWTNCLVYNIGCDALATWDGNVAVSPIGVGVHNSAGTATPYGNIKSIVSTSFNGAGYVYEGVDFTLSYRYDLANGDSLALRALATWSTKQTYQGTVGTAPVSILGQLGSSNTFLADNQPAPRLQGNINLTYNHGPFSVTGMMRYVSSGTIDYNGCSGYCPNAGVGETVSLSTNRVPSYQIFGLRTSYKWDNVSLAKSVTLWGSVDNLFDKDPPFAAGVGAFGINNVNGGANATYYDTVGRFFRVGVRLAF